MSEPLIFSRSFALFDAEHRLIDWSEGFVQEFSDAASIIVPGTRAKGIYAACLLPERALDLTWSVNGDLPPTFEYINNRLTISVEQELGVSGNVLRIARSTNTVSQLHPSMCDNSTELLRSAALQVSASVLKQRDLETSRLNDLAHKDRLTGVGNRLFFEEQLIKNWQQCHNAQKPLSMIFIDVDYFNSYSDFYGFTNGEATLKMVVAKIRAYLDIPRESIARYEAEQFACLLPESDLSNAMRKAEALELAIRALAIMHEKSETESIVTISVGVASTEQTHEDDDASSLVAAAGQQLYIAKRAGRGCVRCANLY